MNPLGYPDKPHQSQPPSPLHQNFSLLAFEDLHRPRSASTTSALPPRVSREIPLIHASTAAITVSPVSSSGDDAADLGEQHSPLRRRGLSLIKSHSLAVVTSTVGLCECAGDVCRDG